MKRWLFLSALFPLAMAVGGDAVNTWTDPVKAAAEDPDFLLQGEYGSAGPGGAWGAQVVALSGGAFDVYLLEGGLPGVGWTRERARIKLSGKLEKDGVVRMPSGDGVSLR